MQLRIKNHHTKLHIVLKENVEKKEMKFKELRIGCIYPIVDFDSFADAIYGRIIIDLTAFPQATTQTIPTACRKRIPRQIPNERIWKKKKYAPQKTILQSLVHLIKNSFFSTKKKFEFAAKFGLSFCWESSRSGHM